MSYWIATRGREGDISSYDRRRIADVARALLAYELNLEGHDYVEVLEELRAALTAVPGTQITIGQPIGHRIDHMLSGTRASIALNIFGPDLHTLRTLAAQVEAAVAAVHGTVDVATEQQAEVPQIRVAMNRAALARYGVTPRQLAEQLDVAFAGEAVSQVLEQQRSFDDIREQVRSTVTLPQGYYIEYGGQFESAEAATRRIALLSLLSLGAILLLLYMEFGSVRQALLVMVNLPLALVGGVFAVLVTGGVLNIATLVGFITLFGIAVRNGILMVSHYNQLLREGAALQEAVHRGSMERLNPIFMTALTAGLALLPLALAGGQPGNEIQSPMAVVVLGGLLTSLALNMVVVPVLYMRYGTVGRDVARNSARAVTG